MAREVGGELERRRMRTCRDGGGLGEVVVNERGDEVSAGEGLSARGGPQWLSSRGGSGPERGSRHAMAGVCRTKRKSVSCAAWTGSRTRALIQLCHEHISRKCQFAELESLAEQATGETGETHAIHCPSCFFSSINTGPTCSVTKASISASHSMKGGSS